MKTARWTLIKIVEMNVLYRDELKKVGLRRLVAVPRLCMAVLISLQLHAWIKRNLQGVEMKELQARKKNKKMIERTERKRKGVGKAMCIFILSRRIVLTFIFI
ncbi:hypothetical protein Adt_16224 [Abeliophyllum distichum]|uniref:Uncharacterized protein n=1 Tax=Abeliophyllum distichum TaxID=126358 RepID=A0ABD1TD06_9LAMI